MARKQKRLGNKGFSLVELIVVIAIMAVLVGVLAPVLIKNVEKSKESTDIQNLDTLRGAVTTALSNEDVYNEMASAFGSGSSVTITLGSGASASLSNVSSSYSKLYSELSDTVKSDIHMKSKAARTGTMYVQIKDGKVTVLVGTDSSNAIKCDKLSGQSFISE